MKALATSASVILVAASYAAYQALGGGSTQVDALGSSTPAPVTMEPTTAAPLTSVDRTAPTAAPASAHLRVVRLWGGFRKDVGIGVGLNTRKTTATVPARSRTPNPCGRMRSSPSPPLPLHRRLWHRRLRHPSQLLLPNPPPRPSLQPRSPFPPSSRHSPRRLHLPLVPDCVTAPTTAASSPPTGARSR